MSERQIYELTQSAKDALFEIINDKKYSWGYENWVKLLEYTRRGRYTKCAELIKTFRNSKAKRDALRFCDDIRYFTEMQETHRS